MTSKISKRAAALVALPMLLAGAAGCGRGAQDPLTAAPAAAPSSGQSDSRQSTDKVDSRAMPAGSRRATYEETATGKTATFVLPGRANSNTIPAGGATKDNAESAHPETRLAVVFVRGEATMPELPVDPTFFDITRIDVHGWDGQLSVPKTGYGAQRVDWVDGAGYHAVICERLRTADGESGLRPDALRSVADGLY